MRHYRAPCARCGGAKEPGGGRKVCDACRATPVPVRPCPRCGEPLAKAKRLCEDCRLLSDWRWKQRQNLRTRKPCQGCGKAKGPGRWRRYCDRCRAKRAEPVLCRHCGERPVRYATAKLCEPCRLLADAHWRIKKREYNQRYQDKYRGRKRTRDPEAVSEQERIGRRLRAERNGTPMRELSDAEYVARYGTGRGKNQARVDAAPLVPYLRDVFDLDALAEGIGLSSSFLDRVAHGHYEDLAIPDADRIATGVGAHFALLYPDLA